MTYRRAVFIITYKKPGKYLLLRRKLHWRGWEFPKGGIEHGEPQMLAAVRELKEETGNDSLALKKFNVFGRYVYDKKTARERGHAGQDYVLFAAEIKGKTIKLDKKEHSAYKWVSYKEALKTLTWPNQKKCLKVVNSVL